jgi:metal-sulfur cluster biosynthetic enzyme
MAVNEETVREALKQVIDPELFINIIDLGLVYVVEVVPAAAQNAVEGAAETSDDKAAAPEDQCAGEKQCTGEKQDVKIEMTMTSPACPAGPQLIAQSKSVVGAMDGVNSVEIKIVMVPPWTPDRMTEDARDQLGIF